MTSPASPPTPLLHLSTQFRHWRFSPSALHRARLELNQGAVGRVRAKLEEERAQAPSGSQPPPPIAPNQVEYLTVSDELELVGFYLTKISQLCRASFFKFPETVEATAMSYLKRFYLMNTCMDYHPKNIMLTCLFLATKTENVMISIDSFASRIPKTTNDDVLALEFLAAQSLRFQFKVHHAHLAARGIYLDLQQTKALQPPLQPDYLLSLWPKVSALLRSARLTDAEFLWLPSQIATAAWWSVDHALTEAWLAEKANRPASATPSSAQPQLGLDQLLDILKQISQILIRAADTPVDKDRVTLVDRRLRFCTNPEKDPSSTLYKIKQAALETEHLAKQREKHAKDTVGDPFA